MTIFSYHGIESAQIGSGRNYIGIGQFQLRCQGVSESMNHRREPIYEATFEVLASDNPNQPPGSVVSFYNKMTTEVGLGNLKGFLEAIINRGIQSGSDVQYSLSQDQPIANRIVWCRGRQTIIGKNNPQNPGGREWVVYDWFPMENQQPLVVPMGFSPQPMQPQFQQQPMQPQQQPMQPQQQQQWPQQPMQPQQPQQQQQWPQQPMQPQQQQQWPQQPMQPQPAVQGFPGTQQPMQQQPAVQQPAVQQPQGPIPQPLTNWKPIG